MKKTRNRITGILFFFNLGVGLAFIFIVNADSAMWGHWFNFNIALLTFWFGSKTAESITKSKWYRPELDDDHPEVQQAAIQSIKERYHEKSSNESQGNL